MLTPATPRSATEGEAFTGTVATFTDADPRDRRRLHGDDRLGRRDHRRAAVIDHGATTGVHRQRVAHLRRGGRRHRRRHPDRRDDDGAARPWPATASRGQRAADGKRRPSPPPRGQPSSGAVATFTDADPGGYRVRLHGDDRLGRRDRPPPAPSMWLGRQLQGQRQSHLHRRGFLHRHRRSVTDDAQRPASAPRKQRHGRRAADSADGQRRRRQVPARVSRSAARSPPSSTPTPPATRPPTSRRRSTGATARPTAGTVSGPVAQRHAVGGSAPVR